VKRGGPKNIVASVQARLVERSRELGVEHQLTLARFGGERLLYRLSTSEFADRFILKGAALLLLWLGEPIRPTKDVDLLGVGDTSAEALKGVFVQLCAIESPDDGLTFLPDSVHVEAIREDQEAACASSSWPCSETFGFRCRLMSAPGTPSCHHRKCWTIQASSTSRAPDSVPIGQRPPLPRRPKQWCGSRGQTAG
jgi:Nucleotidyl transferase AbiEii toxin, Type IV TA system